jgi:hypothetical protein
MSHLMESTKRMAENDSAIEKIDRVGVGNIVVYHGRYGSMRQGRTEFPAIVLKQHEDDGSIDLIVWFEAEDMIWEQRVCAFSEQQPNHCWTPVDSIDGKPDDRMIDALVERLDKDIEDIRQLVDKVAWQMYGEYEAPQKSMIEYLDDFDKRLKRLEKSITKLETY